MAPIDFRISNPTSSCIIIDRPVRLVFDIVHTRQGFFKGFLSANRKPTISPSLFEKNDIGNTKTSHISKIPKQYGRGLHEREYD